MCYETLPFVATYLQWLKLSKLKFSSLLNCFGCCLAFTVPGEAALPQVSFERFCGPLDSSIVRHFLHYSQTRHHLLFSADVQWKTIVGGHAYLEKDLYSECLFLLQSNGSEETGASFARHYSHAQVAFAIYIQCSHPATHVACDCKQMTFDVHMCLG